MAAVADAPRRSKREQLWRRWQALKSERTSWVPHWQDISRNLLPRNGRYLVTDANRGDALRQNTIYNSAGTQSLDVMVAGLMSGASSPARPWFRLEAADQDLNRYQPARLWLDQVTDRILRVFSASNTYGALHQVYEELGAFGTAATLLVDDFDTVIHHHVMTIGEYAIGTDYKGRPNTFYREFRMTVGQLVGEFGLPRCSSAVRNLYTRGQHDEWRTIIHAIEPRAFRELTDPTASAMAYASCYFEEGSREDEILRESGFEEFPVLLPRWRVRSGDIYGHSPGMTALADIKSLQLKAEREAYAIDLETDPPLQGPGALTARQVERTPGGYTTVPDLGPHSGVKRLFESRIVLGDLQKSIADDEARVDRAFFADLFRMLSNRESDTRMTATEVAERHEEKLVILGPVLERLQNELHSPLVNRTYERLAAAGALPPPPPDIEGMEIAPRFVSILAQAQKAIGLNSQDRFVGGMLALVESRPEIMDKLDVDALVDGTADALGIDPRIVVPTEKAARLRDARNKANAAKEQALLMDQHAAAAKSLGSTPTGGDPNLLTDLGGADLLNQFSGYGSPSPLEVA